MEISVKRLKVRLSVMAGILAALAVGITIGLAGVSRASQPVPHCPQPLIADGRYSLRDLAHYADAGAAYAIWIQATCGESAGGGDWYWRRAFARYLNHHDWSAPFPRGMRYWLHVGP